MMQDTLLLRSRVFFRMGLVSRLFEETCLYTAFSNYPSFSADAGVTWKENCIFLNAESTYPAVLCTSRAIQERSIQKRSYSCTTMQVKPAMERLGIRAVVHWQLKMSMFYRRPKWSGPISSPPQSTEFGKK